MCSAPTVVIGGSGSCSATMRTGREGQITAKWPASKRVRMTGRKRKRGKGVLCPIPGCRSGCHTASVKDGRSRARRRWVVRGGQRHDAPPRGGCRRHRAMRQSRLDTAAGQMSGNPSSINERWSGQAHAKPQHAGRPPKACHVRGGPAAGRPGEQATSQTGVKGTTSSIGPRLRQELCLDHSLNDAAPVPS